MFYLVLALIILFVASLVLSVVFFLRFLIFKKNRNWGIASLVYILLVALSAVFFYLSLTQYNPDRYLIRKFEERTGLTFPASGVMITKSRTDFDNIGLQLRLTIRMDSVDLMNILHEVRTRCESFERMELPTTITYSRFVHFGGSDWIMSPYARYEEFENEKGFELWFGGDRRTLDVWLIKRQTTQNCDIQLTEEYK